MTTVDAALLPGSPWRTLTVRQCAKALAWTAGLTLVFTIWYAIERWGIRNPKPERFARSPALVPMIALGIPHFIIGFLFLFTSPRLKTAQAWGKLLVLASIGAALCWLYWSQGARQAIDKLPIAAVSLFFVIHELRDEAFFFQSYGDAPSGVDPTRVRSFLSTTTFVIVALLGGAALFGFDLHSEAKGRHGPLDLVVPEWGAAARGALVVTVVALLVLARARSWSSKEPDGVGVWMKRSRPMGAVYLMFLGVVAIGALTQNLLEAIVLWHVMGWFVFAMHQIGRREGKSPPPTKWIARVKGTRRGFFTLHLGLAVIVFALMLVWTYGTGKSTSSPLWVVAAPDAFYYWTIMHVSMSFLPR